MLDRFIHKNLQIPYHLKKHVDTGRGPAVVFLHGVAGNYHVWDNVIPLLSERNRCVSFDLLGFGDSPKPDWLRYTAKDHVASIRRSIRALHIHEPFILVGHSMGSILAVEYARSYPRDTYALVLCSMPIYQPVQGKSKLTLTTDNIYASIYKRILANKDLSLQQASAIKKMIRDSKVFDPNEENWHATALSIENTILQQRTLDIAQDLPQHIELISGRLDPLVIKKNLEKFADIAPHAQLTYVSATHLINKPFTETIASKVTNIQKNASNQTAL